VAIAKLQRCLERLYDVNSGHDVEQFVVHDLHLSNRLAEALLIQETPDRLDVSLHLDAALVDRLRQDDPTVALHDGNLCDFLTALEGVSHFLYLVWSASHDRRVSLLELELQAEIDKFIVAATLLARHHGGAVPPELARWVFDEDRIDPALSDELRERYRLANRLARRYCHWLQHRYMRRGSSAGMISELRRFYRLANHDKMARINYELRH